MPLSVEPDWALEMHLGCLCDPKTRLGQLNLAFCRCSQVGWVVVQLQTQAVEQERRGQGDDWAVD